MRDEKRDREIIEKATPGPWEWDINSEHHDAKLMSQVGLRYIVMDFVRWAMHSAQPRFRSNDRLGIMRPMVEWLKQRVDHHRGFDLDIDHPDARFIAESRAAWPYYMNLCAELRDRAERAERALVELRDMLHDVPELNLSNYDHEEVVELNNGATNVYLAAERMVQALAGEVQE